MTRSEIRELVEAEVEKQVRMAIRGDRDVLQRIRDERTREFGGSISQRSERGAGEMLSRLRASGN